MHSRMLEMILNHVIFSMPCRHVLPLLAHEQTMLYCHFVGKGSKECTKMIVMLFCM